MSRRLPLLQCRLHRTHQKAVSCCDKQVNYRPAQSKRETQHFINTLKPAHPPQEPAISIPSCKRSKTLPNTVPPSAPHLPPLHRLSPSLTGVDLAPSSQTGHPCSILCHSNNHPHEHHAPRTARLNPLPSRRIHPPLSHPSIPTWLPRRSQKPQALLLRTRKPRPPSELLNSRRRPKSPGERPNRGPTPSVAPAFTRKVPSASASMLATSMLPQAQTWGLPRQHVRPRPPTARRLVANRELLRAKRLS